MSNIFAITLTLLKILIVHAGDQQKLLYDRLLHGYNKLVRPVRNESEAVKVYLGMDLQQIIDIDEKSQAIRSNIWLRMSWRDIYLMWDPYEYGNIREVRLPVVSIWKPDVLLYNSIDKSFDSFWPVNVIVTYDGNVTWIPPANIHASCRILITWFPFDDQNCILKFGSWTYSGLLIDLYNGTVSLDPYTPSGEWNLLKVTSIRNVIFYECCPEEPYHDVFLVSVTISIRRRTLYYAFNLIIPSLLISSLTLLGFTLPPDSGEKLNLCMTTFMSLSVFMLMVVETMPQTSDTVPLIAVYFTCVMFEVGTSIACTVLVLNFHHRDVESYHPMSKILRKLLLEWIPKVFGMKQPPKMKIPHAYNPKNVIGNATRKLATIVIGGVNMNEGNSYAKLSEDHEENDRTKNFLNYSSQIFPVIENPAPKNLVETDKNPKNNGSKNFCFGEDQFEQLISHLRVITAKVQKEELANEVKNEWMFAAMVVDRICFTTFSIFFFTFTVIIVWRAPFLFA